MNNEKAEPIPPFPVDDDRSIGFHIAVGTLDAAASLVPGASYGVQQLVRQFIGEPLERRREGWFTSLGIGVRELQDRLDGFDPATLGQNEEFIDTVAETTRVAMATHRAEKLEALRNAVLNTAIGLTVEEAQRGTFIALLERFSTLHLRLMQVLSNPLEMPEILAIGGSKAMMPVTDALVAAFRERADRAVVGTVLTDLQSAHLLRDLNTAAISPDPLTSRCLTPLGESFVRFISSPLV
ncbi:hypothetical protein [Methylobacterium sp. B1]|uniref:hypothetical protein n=1 Tax=Methylobacterium sp. B1 TaxID=91459 RepID=UPI00034614D4|nr:hypothetical protein [Methylobacterium sp. B1]